MLDENERREDAGRTLASDGLDFLSSLRFLFLVFTPYMEWGTAGGWA